MILTLTAASGVGKSTFLKTLREVPGLAVHPLTSTTTRLKRGDELPGEYEHVSHAMFDAMAIRGEFLQPFDAYDNRYGTRLSLIDQALASDDLYVPILVIPAVKLFANYAASKNKSDRIMHVYLDLDDENERRRRLAGRNEQDMGRQKEEIESWRVQAKQLGVPFLFLDARNTPEELVRQTLAHFNIR